MVGMLSGIYLVNQVCANGTTFGHDKSGIVQTGNGVLRIDLEEFGLHVLTLHQVDCFQIDFNSHHFGR
jgi:hypothetical protein